MENYFRRQKLIIDQRFNAVILRNIDCLECSHRLNSATEEKIH
jgi:hypothetical protein